MRERLSMLIEGWDIMNVEHDEAVDAIMLFIARENSRSILPKICHRCGFIFEPDSPITGSLCDHCVNEVYNNQ